MVTKGQVALGAVLVGGVAVGAYVLTAKAAPPPPGYVAPNGQVSIEILGSTVTVTGVATAGYPKPVMALEIYEDASRVSIGEISSADLALGQPYQLSFEITAPGNHIYYGRMTLVNDTTPVVQETEHKQVTIGAATVLTPTGDAWVSQASPTVNMNRDGLGIGKWGYLNRTLLKFDVSGLGIPAVDISGVEIRLYGLALYSPITVKALITANSFDEAMVTWNNQPAPTPLNGIALMGSTSNVPLSLGWYSIALDPAFLKARLGYSFVAILESENEGGADNYCYAEDKEGGLGLGTQYAPQLIIRHTPD